jgi:hypothetical protein
MKTLDIGPDEAECQTKYGCFAIFFERQKHDLPINCLVTPTLEDQRLTESKLVAIEEIMMRAEDGKTRHGWLYLFISQLKPQTRNLRCTTIVATWQRAQCYRQYGYVTLPGTDSSIFPVGTAIWLKCFGEDLGMGKIVAVQKFRPIWTYLFIVAREQ